MNHVSRAYKRAVATECITKINTPSDKQQPFHCLQPNNMLFVYEGRHNKAKVKKKKISWAAATHSTFILLIQYFMWSFGVLQLW